MTPPTPILDALAKHPDDDQPELLHCYRVNMAAIEHPERFTEKSKAKLTKLRGLVLHQHPSQYDGGPAFLILWNDGNTTVWLRKHLIPATLDPSTP